MIGQKKVVHTLTKRPGAPDEISRTKIGGILVGASTIIAGIGYYLLEESTLFDAIQTIGLGVGEILVAIGIRDALP